ncbi:hypothetical protein [Bartonella vinsonii]|uniref:hypothetical protein n=1 Tax=Bartonella vinsonii TaxID=33047 RepID=UPI000345042A|nr:hypothetical protein [Bartonella vinsonii]
MACRWVEWRVGFYMSLTTRAFGMSYWILSIHCFPPRHIEAGTKRNDTAIGTIDRAAKDQ